MQALRKAPLGLKHPSSSPWRRLIHPSSDTQHRFFRPERRHIWTHVFAGVAGGLTVVCAGYAYYHFSGIKRVVDASKHFRVYLEQTKQSVAQRHPNEALEYLRRLAKSYTAILPGSGIILDRLFDSVDQIIEEHREEASVILEKALQEIEEVKRKKDSLTNPELAAAVLTIVGKHLNEIGSLGVKAGGGLIAPVRERLPDTSYVTQKANDGVGFLTSYFDRKPKDKDKENGEESTKNERSVQK